MFQPATYIRTTSLRWRVHFAFCFFFSSLFFHLSIFFFVLLRFPCRCCHFVDPLQLGKRKAWLLRSDKTETESIFLCVGLTLEALSALGIKCYPNAISFWLLLKFRGHRGFVVFFTLLRFCFNKWATDPFWRTQALRQGLRCVVCSSLSLPFFCSQ